MFETTTILTPAGRAVLRRTHRATLAISVLPNGTLELTAPRDASEAEIAAKIKKRLGWILRQRSAFSEMNRQRMPERFVSGATHRYLGKQYRLKVRPAAIPGVKLAGGYFHVGSRSGTPRETEILLNAWLRQKAHEQFSKRLAKWEQWCAVRHLPTPRVRLLRMPKRWGSSHRDGRIHLHPDLIKAPSICVDYVIIHEVCHLKYPHHDRNFFRLLDQLCPNWRHIKTRLENF